MNCNCSAGRKIGYPRSIVVLLILTISAITFAQENTGQTKQGVISGQPVTLFMQEEMGLLTLTTPTGTCSASLLTNEWIITAAHCLKPGDISSPNQVSLTANWKTVQNRTAEEIRSLRNLPINVVLPDVALIKVRVPFNVFGSTRHFRRELFANRMDNLVGYPLETYGRGINVLAQGSGITATPSQSDGQYRIARTQISRVDNLLYWFPRNGSNQIVAGGDSGGPSFIITRTGRALAGVHSLCKTFCLPGQVCQPRSWTWISGIPECGDAPIATVYQIVKQVIDESMISLARDPASSIREGGSTRVEGIKPTPPSVEGTFNTSVPSSTSVSYIYNVGANGNLEYRRHDGAEKGLPQWQAAVPLGSGFGSFTAVFTGGKNIIYAINNQGDLLWYRHNSAYDLPVNRRRQTALSGPILVSKGWQAYRNVFSGGDGVIYAIDQAGNLLWYKHKQYAEPVEMPTSAGSGMVGAGLRLNWAKSWESLTPKTVGRGWGEFSHVFPGGDGIIYAVTADGKLLRYRHVTYLDGRGIESPGAWEGPVNINSGWGGYQHFFSRGDGIIYAVSADGELFWFKDGVPRSGGQPAVGRSWYGPRKVDDGWGSFQQVFALLPISAPNDVR